MNQVKFAFENATANKTTTLEEKWLRQQLAWSNKRTVTTSLTPYLASIILENNFSKNRTISEGKVIQYARDIEEGRWKHNGETIKILTTGELGDGQHRCHAVILADKAIKTEITFGITEQDLMTVDAGLKRTTAQQLQMIGYQESNLRAAIAQAIILYRRDNRMDRKQANRLATQSEIIAFIEKNDLTTAIQWARMISKKFKVFPRLIGALFFVLNEIDSKDAFEFFNSLETGENINSEYPVYKLRERLLAMRKQDKLDNRVCSIILQTWNACRRKKRLRNFVTTLTELPLPL